MSFESLGLAEPVARAVSEAGYVSPTPIQAAAIPAVMAGRDLLGIAQTGTGKTAAFALPVLHGLAARPARPEPKSVRVLVLAPTRELVGQIVESFQSYGRHLRLTVRIAIGGVPIGKQIRGLSGGADVLVATPGRLMDLVRTRAVRLDKVEVLVLDEADRMLDMGFIHDIRKLVAMLPKQRQTLFFSATMPAEIAGLADGMLNDPEKVSVTPVSSTAERIEQRVAHVDRGGKPALLANYLKSEPVDRALVFTRTKRGADRVTDNLAKAGIAAEAIHGNKSQSQRERALAAFRQGRVKVLVATDIAARGIDIDGISHVFNYELPEVPETYVHRIGRTARAGREGTAISLCSGDEASLLRAIEKLTRSPIVVIHGEPLVAEKVDSGKRPENRRNRNRRRDRPAAAGGEARTGDRQEAKGKGRQQKARRPAYDPLRPKGDFASMPFLGSPRRHARGTEESPAGAQ